MISLLIVEDHPIVVEGLQKMFRDSSFAEVVGVAGSGQACRDVLRWIKPDIILLDINLPDVSGIDLCIEILKNNPKQKILALSTFGERHVIRQMLDHGAKGYILKNSSPEEILEGIKVVQEGGKYLSAETEEMLRDKSKNELVITRREREILKLLSEGFTNAEIAEKLFISPLTADSHRKNLITKLNARNTPSLIKLAMEKGLI